MKKLKDFFYHVNDVLLALFIIVIAGGIIFWRVDKIMEYPQQVVEEQAKASSTSSKADQPNKKADTNTASKNAHEPNSSQDANSDVSSTSASGNNDNSEQIWKDGALTKDVTVTISSGSAEDAIKSLIAAGLFSSFAEFEETCTKVGRSVDSIKATTFTFTTGLTKDQIATTVTD